MAADLKINVNEQVRTVTSSPDSSETSRMSDGSAF
jgi:hypothetical protein